MSIRRENSLLADISEDVVAYCRASSEVVANSSRNAELNESARADLLVATITFLRLERERLRLFDENFDATPQGADLRARLVERFNETTRLIDAVDVPQERDYLRRILISAALETSPASDEFALEEAIDATLDAIDDDDERQSTVYEYALFLSKRLANLSVERMKSARVKIENFADDLEFPDERERVAAALTAGSMAAIDASAELNPESAERVHNAFHRVMENLALIRSPEGLVQFYDAETIAYMDRIGAPRLRSSLDDSFDALLRTLENVEREVETKEFEEIDEAGNKEVVALTDDYVEERLEFLSEVAPCNPLLADRGDEIRAFV